VTHHLTARYTVALYDRRGFSRSQLQGPRDYDRRLETDADDVGHLLDHSSDEPATVFGVSSGAIVALEALARHPTVVRTVVAHEPPAVTLLPDGQKWLDFFAEVYDLYRRSGIEPALTKFREQAFAESDRQAMARAPANEYTLPDATYWFEHELRQYPPVDLDLDALKAHADRIVLTAGRESRGSVCHRVSVQLAKQLGVELHELPGGHVGVVTQPAAFARELLQVLASTRAAPKAGDRS
jgi:pimeloyl-ACP methyl ester carboxylesterase